MATATQYAQAPAGIDSVTAANYGTVAIDPNAPMPQVPGNYADAQTIIAARQAAIAQEQERIANSTGEKITGAATLGVSLAGPHTVSMASKAAGVSASAAGKVAGQVAAPLTFATTAFTSERDANKKWRELGKLYLAELAEKRGINALTASEADLKKELQILAKEEMLRGNPQLEQEVKAISSGTATNLVSSGVGMAATTVGTVFGGPIGFAAGMAASEVTSRTAKKVMNNVNGVDPNDTPHQALKRLNDKLQGEQPQPVTGMDVISVALAGNSPFSQEVKAQIKMRTGEDYTKMHPDMQAHTLTMHYPPLLEGATAAAKKINTGEMLPTKLIGINWSNVKEHGVPSVEAQTQHDLMKHAGTPTTMLSAGPMEHEFMAEARARGMGAQQAGLVSARDAAMLQGNTLSV